MGFISKIQVLTFLLTIGGAFGAEPVDFDSLWKNVRENSHGILAEKTDFLASEAGAARAGRHWAPRILANAQIVSTNDPGTTLFSNLGSRSLLASDLNPDSMNHPDRHWFKRGGLTLDWALFEGGSGVAFATGSNLEKKSRELAFESRVNEEYAEIAGDYAKLMTVRSEISAYSELKAKLQSFLSRYKLGSKDNPVGYSGLLGMRALLNRLDGYIDQARVDGAALERTLLVRSGLEEAHVSTPQNLKVAEFIDLKLPPAKSVERTSLRAEAAKIGANAQAEYAKANRAHWLPKMGLFANGSLTSGPRDIGTSTEYGAYLQWELFNAGNVGVYREANLKAIAAQERADEATQNSRMADETLSESVPTLRENLRRIEDSLELTAEQVSVTEKLFRNGSINALQFVEVLSRRTDVVQSHHLGQYAYVDSVAARFIQTGGKR